MSHASEGANIDSVRLLFVTEIWTDLCAGSACVFERCVTCVRFLGLFAFCQAEVVKTEQSSERGFCGDKSRQRLFCS